jgi:hypothetical protein
MVDPTKIGQLSTLLLSHICLLDFLYYFKIKSNKYEINSRNGFNDPEMNINDVGIFEKFKC